MTSERHTVRLGQVRRHGDGLPIQVCCDDRGVSRYAMHVNDAFRKPRHGIRWIGLVRQIDTANDVVTGHEVSARIGQCVRRLRRRPTTLSLTMRLGECETYHHRDECGDSAPLPSQTSWPEHERLPWMRTHGYSFDMRIPFRLRTHANVYSIERYLAHKRTTRHEIPNMNLEVG